MGKAQRTSIGVVRQIRDGSRDRHLGTDPQDWSCMLSLFAVCHKAGRESTLEAHTLRRDSEGRLELDGWSTVNEMGKVSSITYGFLGRLKVGLQAKL